MVFVVFEILPRSLLISERQVFGSERIAHEVHCQTIFLNFIILFVLVLKDTKFSHFDVK
jgi:hypothetical protein